MMFYRETDFKETLIGKFPKEWGTTKLSELSEHITKGTTPTTYGFGYTASGVNFIKVESIDERGAFIPKNIPHITEEANEAFRRSILQENDILFSIAGALGRVATVTNEILPANTNQAIAIIRPKEKNRLSAEYLKYFLMGSQIQNFVRTIAIQSQQANINLEHVRNLTVTLPPLVEQHEIVEVLSCVDLIIQKNGEVIAKIQRLKKGLMQKLLTEGIGHKEFKNTKLGRIPETWKVVKLKEITAKIKDIDHIMPKKQQEGIPFVSIKCMLKYSDFGFTINPSDPNLEFISKEDYEYHVQRFNVEEEDIIYSRFGSIGNAKLVATKQPFIASYSIVLVKPDRLKVVPAFLTSALNSEVVRREAKIATKGATNRNLHLEDIQKLELPLPPIQEQQRIADILFALDKKLGLEREQRAKVERIRQSLMDLLLSGKVRVRVD